MDRATSTDHVLLPIVLTLVAVALGVLFFLTLGTTAGLAYTITMPVPMFLLWMTRDVQSFDERLAELEKHHV